MSRLSSGRVLSDWSPNKGLVGFWMGLPDSIHRSNNKVQDIARGFDGTPVASPLLGGISPGIGAHSSRFTITSDQYIDIGTGPVTLIDSTGVLAVSLWARFFTLGTKGLVSNWNGNGFCFYQYNSAVGAGKILFEKYNSYASILGSTNMNLGAWHHLAATYDGANVVLYLNGVQDGSGAASGWSSGTGLKIGILGVSVGHTSPDADISCVRVYNRTLTAGEVRSIYHDERTGGWKSFRRGARPTSHTSSASGGTAKNLLLLGCG